MKILSYHPRNFSLPESALQFATYFLMLFALSSCSIFGIHLSDYNPKKAGKYPVFSKETILLGELTPLRENFDVTFYNLDIEINPNEKTLDGWVEMRAIAKTSIDTIQLDLDQVLNVDEIRWNKRDAEKLTYSRESRAIYVRLPQQLNKGQSFSVHVKYSGLPQVAKNPPWEGGVVWKKDSEKNDWAGVACESEGASVWFPCKDHTSDEPDSAQMRFTIANNNLSVISNGVFFGKETSANNTASFTWKVSYPINVYNITFYVGNFEKIDDNYIGIDSQELKITHYVLKPNVEKAKEHFKQVKEHIRIYEELYGGYPWYRDGFKLVESPYAGMEHQTAIAYGNGYNNDLVGGQEDYIMLHESGHEWFGNAVTAYDLAEVWLQEGITTYGEYLYLEKKYGSKEAYNHLAFYRMTIKNKFPVVGPAGRRHFNSNDGDVYVKGAWMLHTLRNDIDNDSLFFTVLQTFYRENKLKITDTKTFIETVRKVTGKDYLWFFDQYLYHNKVPFLEFLFIGDGRMLYRWTNVSEGFYKLRVTMSFDGMQQTRDIYPSSKVQLLKLSGDEKTAPSVLFNNSQLLYGVQKNKRLQTIYREGGD